MRKILLAAAALSLTGAAAPRDWTKTVVNTATGWRAGNPAAPTKLVEYGSPNCPHCAHFAEATDAGIMARVKSGKLSFEYRPYMIFPHDVAAALITRCVPLGRRFAFVHDYYRNSAGITDKLRDAMSDDAKQAELEAAREQSIAAYNRKVVALTGMTALAARYGLTAAATNRCVANQAGLDWLQKTQSAAKSAGVNGTPTYMLNGERLSPGSPEDLLAALK